VRPSASAPSSALTASHRTPRGFAHVETWVFDLDNTLYPHHLLWQQVDDRIRAYVAEFLKVSKDEAFRVQKDYYKRYGTTMRGLMTEHGLDPDDYLEYVHQIDHSPLEPNPALGAALGPAWRRQRAPWTVIASIQAAVGRVAAQGVAFDVNQNSNDFLPGFGAGLMATVGSDRWFAWGSVRALIWPIQSRVQAVEVAMTSAQPIARSLGRLESDLTLGAGLRLP